MSTIEDVQISYNSKKISSETILLKLKMILNKELYQNKSIDYDLYTAMQKKLIKRMDSLPLKEKD